MRRFVSSPHLLPCEHSSQNGAGLRYVIDLIHLELCELLLQLLLIMVGVDRRDGVEKLVQ